MNFSNLRAPRKANENKKRVGRGMGSGMGKTSTRGHKGQGSRSGSSMMRGFEGGQMPLHRRLPKRGFTNIFKTEYEVVNLDRLAEPRARRRLRPRCCARRAWSARKKSLVKVLGSGELSSALTVHAHKFSKSAQEKIEKAGGNDKAVVSCQWSVARKSSVHRRLAVAGRTVSDRLQTDNWLAADTGSWGVFCNA